MKSNKSVEAVGSNTIWIYVKGIIAAYIFVLFIFLIMALVITYTSIPEALIPMFASITMIVSASISGMYVGVKMKKKGWLNGAMEGLLYVFILIVMSWAFMKDFSMDRYALLKSLIGIVSGGIGGMIGVNLK